MDGAEGLASCLESFERQIWEESADHLRSLEESLFAQEPTADSLAAVLRELSDETLALAVQKGFLVRKTFTELFVTRYGPYLARWLFRWGTESHQALDIIQDLYLKFYERRLGSYRPDEGFRGYLHQAARNLWVQKVWRTKKCGSLEEQAEIASAAPSPDQHLLDQEAAARIDDALQALRPQEQTVVRATMAGDSADEIARNLNLRKDQVFMYLFRGRRRLERLLGLPCRKKAAVSTPEQERTPETSATPSRDNSDLPADPAGLHEKECNGVETRIRT
jgi:RNA polymerase sigma factor (sigma-70 family)